MLFLPLLPMKTTHRAFLLLQTLLIKTSLICVLKSEKDFKNINCSCLDYPNLSLFLLLAVKLGIFLLSSIFLEPTDTLQIFGMACSPEKCLEAARIKPGTYESRLDYANQ